MWFWQNGSTLGNILDTFGVFYIQCISYYWGCHEASQFFIDFRNGSIEDIRDDITQDFRYFVENCDDDGISPGVIINDNIRPLGNITNDERVGRTSGIALRDKLEESTCNHNM